MQHPRVKPEGDGGCEGCSVPLTPTPTLPLKREGVRLCHGLCLASPTTPNPSPFQGEVRVGVSSKLSASNKTYPRPLSLPYPHSRFLFGRRDRPMEGDRAGAQDVDVQRGSWHYMLRHGDRSAMTGAPGWAVLAITGKSRRPGAATPHFLVPETLSLRDPSTFSNPAQARRALPRVANPECCNDCLQCHCSRAGPCLGIRNIGPAIDACAPKA